MATKGKKKTEPAGDKPGAEIIDIPHEEVKSNGTTESVTAELISTDKMISMQIAKFNLADSAIEQMKNQFSGLVIADIKDKKGYEAVKEAWQETRSKRTALEKKGLELRNQFKVITVAIGKEEDRLIELLKPLEEELHQKWKAIDDEKERVKKEKEAEEQRQLMVRVEEVLGMGMTLQDGFYKIGDTISMDVATLRGLPEDQYEKLKGAITAKAMEIKQAQEAEDKRKKDAADKLKKEQDALKEQQDQLKKAQDELQRQKDDLEKQKQEAAKLKRENRTNKLTGLGLTYNERQDLFEFDNGFKSVTHGGALLFDMDEHGFTEHTNILAGLIKESKDGKAQHDDEVEKEKKALEIKKQFIAKAMETAGLSFSYTAQAFQWEDKNTAISVPFTEILPLDEAAITLKASDVATQIAEAKKLTEKADKDAKDKADKEAKLGLKDRDRFFADVAGLEAILAEIKPEDYKTKKFQDTATKLKADIVEILKAVK